MTYILNIETATNVCSVAVSHNDTVIFERVEHEGPSHANLLGVFVEEALSELKAKGLQLSAVAVSSGPGSYTGLRIGVSHAKGICFGLDIPLIAIPTLEIMAHTVSKLYKEEDNVLLCPMIDARRMEVYDALYTPQDMNQVREVQANIIDEDSFSEELKSNRIIFFGNGAEKTRALLESPNTVYLSDIHPLASDMASLSFNAYESELFEDLAYFEPFYLKDFVATKPKNKVLPPQQQSKK